MHLSTSILTSNPVHVRSTLFYRFITNDSLPMTYNNICILCKIQCPKTEEQHSHVEESNIHDTSLIPPAQSHRPVSLQCAITMHDVLDNLHPLLMKYVNCNTYLTYSELLFVIDVMLISNVLCFCALFKYSSL